MLRVLLIDGVFSAELLGVLGAFVDSKGKPLELTQLQPAADLAPAQSYQSVRAALSQCLLLVRDAERARAAAQLVTVLQLDDEAELPLLVAARTATANLEPARAFYLQLRHAIEASAIVNASAEHIDFRGTAWRALTGDELSDLSDDARSQRLGGYCRYPERQLLGQTGAAANHRCAQ